MRPSEGSEDKRGRIQEMFGHISARYDLLNTLLSFGQDRRWRTKALKRLGLRSGGVLVDVAAGTGDMAIAAARIQPQLAAAFALDFSEPMLRLAKKKFVRKRTAIIPAAADAVALPLRDETADVVTIAFGIRNVVDVPAALGEMARVLRPGGKLLVLEFATPSGRLFGPLFRWYFTRVLPRLGGIVSGSREAYEYLPHSVGEFYSPAEMAALMEGAGFTNIGTTRYSFGVVVAHIGEKAA